MRVLKALFFLACIAGTETGQAAEIICDYLYGQNHDFQKSAPEFWPSGKVPKPENCLVAFLHGEIVDGDYERVKAFIRAHHPFLNAIYIQSPGGSIREALMIGRLFRRYL